MQWSCRQVLLLAKLLVIYHACILYRYRKLSLEREVDQMVNDMIKKEGWTRSYALSVLRSKFESEERYQEVSYVNDLIKKEEEEESQKNTHQFQKDY